MHQINIGDRTIDVPRQLLADLIACARIGAESADDPLGADRANAVWDFLMVLEDEQARA